MSSAKRPKLAAGTPKVDMRALDVPLDEDGYKSYLQLRLKYRERCEQLELDWQQKRRKLKAKLFEEQDEERRLAKLELMEKRAERA